MLKTPQFVPCNQKEVWLLFYTGFYSNFLTQFKFTRLFLRGHPKNFNLSRPDPQMYIESFVHSFQFNSADPILKSIPSDQTHYWGELRKLWTNISTTWCYLSHLSTLFSRLYLKLCINSRKTQSPHWYNSCYQFEFMYLVCRHFRC